MNLLIYISFIIIYTLVVVSITLKLTKRKKKLEIEEISPREAYMNQEKYLINKMHLFDASIYYGPFEMKIVRRGEKYFSDGKVGKIKKHKDNYKAIIKGQDEYKTEVSFYDNDYIKLAKCTCSYFTDKEKPCKHIYALIYAIKCKDNKKNIIKYMNKYSKNIKALIKLSDIYLQKYSLFLDPFFVRDFKGALGEYRSLINYMDKMAKEDTFEEKLLSNLYDLMDMERDLKLMIQNLMDTKDN